MTRQRYARRRPTVRVAAAPTPTLTPLRLALLGAALTVCALLPLARAQTLAEMVTVTSIQGTLNGVSGVSLPTGSSFVKNPKYAAGLAPKLLGADAAKFTGFQLYTARGLATRLADNYVGDLKTTFASQGFFESGSQALKLGADTWTRTNFQDESGKALALLVTKRADGVYFLTAQGK